MSCEHTRRAVLVDPLHLPPSVQDHLATCPDCRHLLQTQLQQTQMLRLAMEQAPPAGLHQRLIQAQALQQPAAPAARMSRRQTLWGLAATVAAGSVGLGVWMSQRRPQQPEQWARVIQKHFFEDPIHLLPPDPEAGEQMNQLLDRLGARRLAELPPVLRARMCLLHDCRSAHLVFNWQDQRAVAFLLPQPVSAAWPVQEGSWRGELRPVVGGMTAVLAQTPAAAMSLGDVLASSVAWQA